MLRAVVKRIARWLFGPYELNRIYYLGIKDYDRTLPAGFDLRRITSADQVTHSPDAHIRSHAWYTGEDAHAFGLWQDGALVCTCVFWNSRRFRDTSIRTLGEKEAIMVDLVTAQDCRGRGYAPVLIRFAELELQRAGFERLYTWVWFSNEPSKRTFEKAGWANIAFVAKVTPRGYGKAIRIERRIRDVRA